MIANDLFALEADLRQQGATCEKLSHEVDMIGWGLNGLLDRAVALHVPDVWQSASAESSRIRLFHQRSQLMWWHNEIAQIAHRLRIRARHLYAEAASAQLRAEAIIREQARQNELEVLYFR